MSERAVALLGLLVLASGCSGVSVEPDDGDHALPPSVETVVVAPDASWAHEDPRALVFLRRLAAKLDARSAARGYGVAFEFGEAPPSDFEEPIARPEGLELPPRPHALWLVKRCDFVPVGRTRRAVPRADALPDLEDDERRSNGRDASTIDAEAVPLGLVSDFTFALRGWIYAPSPERANPPPPPRTISRVSVHGDASFDQSVGTDELAEWFDEALARIADGILDHLPRRTDPEELAPDGSLPYGVIERQSEK